ncbi:MAG: Rieske (2Fe-2S) protein, partial [Halobacteriales archaeon]|nr:Rieske (2Fe-2S) protein [Halobacteriales archaeon]
TGADRSWIPSEDVQDALLADDPHTVTGAVDEAIEQGATVVDLADEIVQAAAVRVAQFSTGNEFSDWNTVHHTYTYANAVCGLVRRADSTGGYGGVYEGAVTLFLHRFLNTPPAPIPTPETTDRAPDAILEDLDETFQTEGEVATAGRLAGEFLDSEGSPDTLKRALGEALLREDAGFHTLQNLEAAFQGYDRCGDPERARVHLIATARYLAAHTPTRREAEQTFRIAERLNRGERIHED